MAVMHRYQPLGTPTKAEAATPGPVEMVTVPALGAEWKSSELRGMTKAGRRQAKSEARQERWDDWRRGRTGLCGGWLTRRVLTFVMFGLCIVVGVALAICLPRVPGFALNSDTPLVNATGSWATEVPTAFLRFPANFSFPAFADLQVNTHSNYLPLRFTSLKAEVYDDNTDRKVAHGEMEGMTLPAKEYAHIQIPLNFTYAAINDTDQTCEYPTVTRIRSKAEPTRRVELVQRVP